MSYLQEKAEIHVTRLFEQFTSPDLVYHNLTHTRQVVQHAHEIEIYYNIPDSDVMIIQTAAWFHDIGHLFGEITGHEKRSVSIMKRFLTGLSVGQEIIDQVAQCILVTQFPSDPKNLNEQIICDADTYHLGTTIFPEADALIKKEMQLRGVATDNWYEQTLQFMHQHKYFTNYCRKILDSGKQKNIRNYSHQNL